MNNTNNIPTSALQPIADFFISGTKVQDASLLVAEVGKPSSDKSALGAGDNLPGSIPECPHTIAEHRVLTLSNGMQQILLQCLACGTKRSSAIKRTMFTAEQLATMPAFDQALVEKGEAERKAYHENYAKVQLALRENRSREMSEEYQAYLRTPAWRERRNAVMRRAQYVCEGCLDAAATEVHHLTYDHIYDELLFELVAMCRTCHVRAHGGKNQ